MRLILKSIFYPLLNIGDVIKIFWPAMLVLAAYVLFMFRGFFFGDSLPLPAEVVAALRSTAATVIIVSYIFMVFCSGVVNWHRLIVLHSPALSARFIPMKREWLYAINVLLFALVSYLYHMVVILLCKTFGLSQAFPGSEELASIILTPLLFAFLLKRLLFRLPSVSVEEKGFYLNFAKLIPVTKGLKWPLTISAVIILTEIVAEIPGIIYLYMMLSNSLPRTMNEFVLLLGFLPTLKVFLIAYGTLAFATMLSIFYRDRVRAELLADNESLKTA